jgi:hypothetical protein
MRGDFKDGDYARFKSHFSKKDAIVGLDLSSDGGDLEEGMQIASLIHQRKLSVYVADDCNSVCAFVFSRQPNAISTTIQELASTPYQIIGISKISVRCG